MCSWQISPEDIRWEDEETGLFRRGGRPGPGRGNKKSIARGGTVAAAGRGRGTIKGQSKKDFSLTKNGVAKKAMGDIEILHTDTLIKEVRWMLELVSHTLNERNFSSLI
jgi:hypothetical protein